MVERYAEVIKAKVRFLFSVECLLTLLFSILIRQIEKRLGWIQENKNNEIIQLITVFITVVFVYGIGEMIRRKLKLKSVIFSKSKLNK